MNWLSKSLISLILVIPFFIGVGFLKKNYGVKPEISIMLWYFGVNLGILVWGFKIDLFKLTQPLPTTLIIYAAALLAGIILGTVANVYFSQALVDAPNAGLPVAILNAAAIPVFVLAYIGYLKFPDWFAPSEFTLIKLIGIVLTVGGIAIISIFK